MRLQDKNIVTIMQPDTSIKPKANFDQSEFFAAVTNHGYDVIWERAIKCPCKGRNSEHLSNCANCGGSGHIYINPSETRMVVQSMSLNPKFESWGVHGAEVSSITANPNDKLSYMDRITVLRAFAEHSEVLHLNTLTVEASPVNYAYTVYKPLQVYFVGLFVASNQKLRKLEPGEYVIEDENKIIIQNGLLAGIADPSITIRYVHNPQYHVIEMVRDTVTVKVKKGGVETNEIMPINARAQRANLIKDRENFQGNRLLDNSFKQCEEVSYGNC